ncbi:hypothetical protein KPP03845_104464 [Streptomyces xanthophaeus]|nr:hypothetical protein KPP03845_104464 [Streptomyces xanthophaeus]
MSWGLPVSPRVLPCRAGPSRALLRRVASRWPSATLDRPSRHGKTRTVGKPPKERSPGDKSQGRGIRVPAGKACGEPSRSPGRSSPSAGPVGASNRYALLIASVCGPSGAGHRLPSRPRPAVPALSRASGQYVPIWQSFGEWKASRCSEMPNNPTADSERDVFRLQGPSGALNCPQTPPCAARSRLRRPHQPPPAPNFPPLPAGARSRREKSAPAACPPMSSPRRAADAELEERVAICGGLCPAPDGPRTLNDEERVAI